MKDIKRDLEGSNPVVITNNYSSDTNNGINQINISDGNFKTIFLDLKKIYEKGLISNYIFKGKIEAVSGSILIFSERLGYSFIKVPYNNLIVPIFGELKNSRTMFNKITNKIINILDLKEMDELFIKFIFHKDDKIRLMIIERLANTNDSLNNLAIFAEIAGTKDMLAIIQSKITNLELVRENNFFLDKIFSKSKSDYIKLIINLSGEPVDIFESEKLIDDIYSNVSRIIFKKNIVDDEIVDLMISDLKFKNFISECVQITLENKQPVNLEKSDKIESIFSILGPDDIVLLRNYLDAYLYIPELSSIENWYQIINKNKLTDIYKRFTDRYIDELHSGWLFKNVNQKQKDIVLLLSKDHHNLWRKLKTRILPMISNDVVGENKYNINKLENKLEDWKFYIDNIGELKTVITVSILKSYKTAKNKKETIRWLDMISVLSKMKKFSSKEILNKCHIQSLLKEEIQDKLSELNVKVKQIEIFVKENSKINSKILEIIVDGPNVLRDSLTEDEISKKEDANRLLILYKTLTNNVGIKKVKIVISAASQRYTHNSDLWEPLIKSGKIIVSPAGRSDDFYALKLAQENKAFVLSNDMYRDWHKEDPKLKKWIESHRLTFKWIKVDNKFIFDEKLTKLEEIK